MEHQRLEKILNENAGWEEYTSIAIQFSQEGTASQWNLGDVLVRVADLKVEDPLLKDKADTLKKFCREIGVTYSSAKEMAKIAQGVEPGLRDERLSYSHFRVIIRHNQAGSDLVNWIEQAIDDNLTVAELDKKIREKLGKATITPKSIRGVLRAFAKKEETLTDDDIIEALREHPEDVVEELKLATALLKRFKTAWNGLKGEA